MSKKIEPAPFLSEFDRQYLSDRGLNPDDYIVEVTEENADQVPPYSEWSVPDLEREVEERNAEEDRDEDDKIEVVGTGKNGGVLKQDLIAALEADDDAAEADDA